MHKNLTDADESSILDDGLRSLHVLPLEELRVVVALQQRESDPHTLGMLHE